jgi:hypothetical protein
MSEHDELAIAHHALPLAQIRVDAHFPGGLPDRIEVIVDGEAIARIHPTRVSYEMDWTRRIPQMVLTFNAGDGHFETRLQIPSPQVSSPDA